LGLPQAMAAEPTKTLPEPGDEAEGEALDALTPDQSGKKSALAELKDAGTSEDAAQLDAAEEANQAATAKAGAESAKAKPDEQLAASTRPSQEPKPEINTAQLQPVSAKAEPLPPGLIALPDAARALQAQALDGKPGVGPQHNGPRVPESPPTSLAAFPIEIGFRALSGTKRFDIRLDPPELGRVDVTLTFDKEGEVTAKLTVDRVETLHLLQRDAKTLERAFDQAGLRPSDAGVQITLSDRNASNGNGFQAEQERAFGASRRDDAEPVPAALIEMIQPRRVRLGGVDVNV
ncbi:MAG: flagellar hook-length control protein FliK, partial [Bosea sp. (in: a-proteobacteria)]